MSEGHSPLPKLTPEENVEKPRKIGCITIMWIVALILIFLVWYNGLRSVPLRITPETTYITEPLTPDGKHVDYVTAVKQKLYPPGVATDDNGYRLVFQRVQYPGRLRDMSPQVVQKFYEELGLNPNIPPDLPYTDIWSFCRRLEAAEPEALEDIIRLIKQERGISEYAEETVEVLGAAFSAGDGIDGYEVANWLFMSTDPHQFPVTRRWVETTGPALDFIAEAVAKPIYFPPMVSQPEGAELYGLITTSAFQEAREYARGLHLRMKYRVGIGDIDGAIDDILACYRLGRHLESHGMIIDALVGIAIEGIGTAMAIDANPAVPASEAQLQRLAGGIRNLPPQRTVEEILEYERFFGLDMIQSLSAKRAPVSSVLDDGLAYRTAMGGTPTTKEKILSFIQDSLGYNWNIVARRYNETYDEVIADTGPVLVPTGMRPLNWLTLNSRSHEIANKLCSGIPALRTCREAFRRKDCCDNMRQIVLAMLIYEQRYGTLPPAFSVDADGQPLHSWRVLLPYLGDESLTELYSQIKLDEPWDSEHNRQFHERNLDIYRCPSAVKNDGEASYSVIVGDDTLFGSDGNGHLLADFKRHIILLTERKEGVCWMRPDAEITQHVAETDHINQNATSIGSNHIGGANFGLRDGSVNFYSTTINSDVFTEQIRGSETRVP